MDIIKEEFSVEPKLYDDQSVGMEYQIVWQDDDEDKREIILGRFSEAEFAAKAFTKYIQRLSKSNTVNIYPDATYEDTKVAIEFKNSTQGGIFYVREKEIIKDRFNFRAAERIFNPEGQNQRNYNNKR